MNAVLQLLLLPCGLLLVYPLLLRSNKLVVSCIEHISLRLLVGYSTLLRTFPLNATEGTVIFTEMYHTFEAKCIGKYFIFAADL